MSNIRISFYPGVNKSELDSGVISEISWQRLHPFLEQAFTIRKGERLVGITITAAGIRAKFETTGNN